MMNETMASTSRSALVSVHGGHSAQFCSHARDSLEDIVCTYIAKGFAWVGITEHMPAVSDALVPPEERDAGLNAAAMYRRFSEYIDTCRYLQKLYAPKLKILVGFETEVCSGYAPFLRSLIEEFTPDYIVGSIHHLHDIAFDLSPSSYQEAVEASGSIDSLYCEYFDQQYDFIITFRPAVVGHFDLIRLSDPCYSDRLSKPEIQRRIDRNLEKIKELGLILDFNVRALAKGQEEPYVSRSILQKALKMGIPLVPGDDSHGVDTVGLYCEQGICLLEELGFDTQWRTPVVS